jgi:hypothetical protein
MDMGVYNQDMFRNSYPSKPSGSGSKKEKKRGLIDMVSAAQMKYAAEKNGVPLPVDVITTGHVWDYSADIMVSGLIDILSTFLLVCIGVLFLIGSGDFYNFHHFSIFNYVIGGFIFSIPASYYSIMLTSTIKRFYEVNLTNTAKLIRLIFNSMLSIQILKFFIINVAFYAIFMFTSKSAWLQKECITKMKFAIAHGNNQHMFFLWDNIWRVLTDYKYRTITQISIDLTIGLFLILLPPTIALIYKKKKTKNIKNTNIMRGQDVNKEKGVDIIHDAKYDLLMTLICGTIGAGKSTMLTKIIISRMLVMPSSKWIFLDITGEYMAQFYRKGDIILDITDERCFLWNFLKEAKSTMVLKEFSSQIIPEEPEGSHGNRFFSEAARIILNDAFYYCYSNNIYQNKDVKKRMLYQPKESFEKIQKLTGNASISFTDVYQTYKNYVDGLLSINTKGEEFSLREWLANQEDDRRIFINYHNDTLETQRPILNLFLTIFSNMILDQNFKSERRINVVIDEFTNVGLLKNFPNTLAQCRKKNVAFIIALQNLKEAGRIYGDRIYNLLDNINNTYAFRTNDDKTAAMLADRFGKIEKKELLANTAVSTAFKQEHTTTYSTSIRETHAILSSEFMTLPNYEYFGKIVTDDGIKFFKAKETKNDENIINTDIYLPTDRDFMAEIKALEDQILAEEEAKKKKEAQEKKQQNQKLSKKDIKETLKKVKKIATEAVEKEENENDNDADNQ